MVKAVNNCNCVEKLLAFGQLQAFNTHSEISNYYNKDIEEGTLCLVQTKATYWATDVSMNDVTVEDYLYPIDFCPVCGKKIEYERIKNLTRK